MKRKLIFTGQWLVTTLILAISLGAYGCADTASVSEDVAAPLSNLTITPGTLQPGFFSNTTNYAVNAPTSATSVTVTAVPKDNTAIVTIDGFVTTQRSVTLGGPGSTRTILIVVETLNGLETTYTVNVTRLLSSDNNLSALTVTPGSLVPAFTSSTLDYRVNVANTVGQVTVTATKSDQQAAMLIESILISPVTIPGGTPSSGPVNIPLTGPGTNAVVKITVTAPNGSKKTYQITINRLSGDNSLRELIVIPGTFNRPFEPGVTDYRVDVPIGVFQVTVTATKSDPNAAMSGSVTAGAGLPTGTALIPLGGPGSETPLSITVAATDPNVLPKTYSVIVKRADPSSNANLSALVVTADSLGQPVDLNTPPPYTVNVAINVIQVTVTATLEDASATLTINGLGTSSGVPSAPITLGPPGSDTNIPITVIAPNGNSKNYPIIVHRDDPGPPPAP
jgi:Cadherin-like beta sandwich domain